MSVVASSKPTLKSRAGGERKKEREKKKLVWQGYWNNNSENQGDKWYVGAVELERTDKKKEKRNGQI